MKIKLNSKASFKSPQLFQKKTSERKIGEKTCPLEKCEIHKHYINRSKSFSAYFDILSILQTFYVFFSRLFFYFAFILKIHLNQRTAFTDLVHYFSHIHLFEKEIKTKCEIKYLYGEGRKKKLSWTRLLFSVVLCSFL